MKRRNRKQHIGLVSLLLAGCIQGKQATTSTLVDATVDVPALDVGSEDTSLTTDVQTPVAVHQAGPWLTDPSSAPRAIHFTWQHDPAGSLTVQWSTGAASLDGYAPKVWYAPVQEASADGAPELYGPGRVVEGAGEMYYQTLLAVGDETPRYATWTAELTGLTPDTTYVLRVGTWQGFSGDHFVQPNLSDVVQARTAPAKGSQDKVTIVLAGDSRGGAAKIAAAADRFAQIPANFWLFNGDFNEQGTQDQWDDWWSAMQPVLSRHPLMPVQGNHEFFPPMYYGQFALPVMPGLPQEQAEHAWSVNYGNIHVVGLDSTQDSVVQDQVPWLDADLDVASHDPAVQWIIVAMHHPAYSSCTNHGSTDRVQKYWVPLFEKHNVDLVFAGHDHDYERSHPIRNSAKADKGPVYIVAGGFFSDGYTNGKDWWTVTSTHGKTSNYVVLDVSGKDLALKAYAGDGQSLLDSYELHK